MTNTTKQETRAALAHRMIHEITLATLAADDPMWQAAEDGESGLVFTSNWFGGFRVEYRYMPNAAEACHGIVQFYKLAYFSEEGNPHEIKEILSKGEIHLVPQSLGSALYAAIYNRGLPRDVLDQFAKAMTPEQVTAETDDGKEDST